MRRHAYLALMFIICITIILSTADAAADLVGARKLVFAFEQKEKNYKHFVYKRELFLWKSISSSQTVNCLQTNTRKKNNIFVQNVQDRTCCLANTVLVESLKSVHCCVSSVSNVCFFPLFKLQIALALFAIFAVAAAKPQWLSPYAYSAYGGYNSPLLATPYAAGASPYIANYQYASPYSSAYSAFVPSAYSSSLVI